MSLTPSPERSHDLPSGVTRLPAGMGWVVSDRALAIRLLSDERLGVVESGPIMAQYVRRMSPELRPLIGELADFAERIMLQSTPDRHRALRKEFGRFFTAEAVARLRRGMRTDAAAVVRQFAAKGGGDFMTKVAFPYAAAFAARLLGMDTPAYLRTHRVSQTLALVAYSLRLPDPEQAIRDGHAALMGIRKSIREARDRAPSGTVLGTWRDSGIGGLSDDDVEANVVMLVQASLETVAGTLGNAAVRILATPGSLADAVERERLLDDALSTLPPLKTLERTVLEPVEVDGHVLTPGRIVTVKVAEANRQDETPVAGNAVLSFGWGAYRCLGARMARYEALELFDALDRFAADVRMSDPAPERIRHIRFDMPRRLDVVCRPRTVITAQAVTAALVDALQEHDLDRTLTSLEGEVASVVMGELGVPDPSRDDWPDTMRRWIAWATTAAR